MPNDNNIDNNMHNKNNLISNNLGNLRLYIAHKSRFWKAIKSSEPLTLTDKCCGVL